jgi:protein SCO1/2
MMVHPAVLGVIMTWLWWKPLTEQLRTRARSLVPLGATSVAIGTALLVLLAVVNPAPAQMLEFPAQALRTEHAAPDIDLTSQEGKAFSLGSLRGEVVLLTGIYASCGQACPLVMAEMKRVLAKLDANERRQVRSVIITLNPEHDDVEVLAKLARHYGVTAPAFTFLTGPAPKVHDTLDRLQILRKKDAASGVIDHTSLFFTIDRKGRIAYRFALGEGQEQWLVEALKVLLAEPA